MAKKTRKKIKFKRPKISRPRLSKPKLTFDRFGQLTFTLKEVSKLAVRVKPKLLIVLFIVSSLWGFLAIPGFYLEKLMIDELIEAVGQENWRPYLTSIGFLVFLALVLSLSRNILGSFNMFLRRTMSRYFDAELSIMIGKKMRHLDMATIDDPDFQNRFNKVERESGRRAWQLMMPLSDIPNYLVGFVSSVGVLVFLSPWFAVGTVLFSIPQLLINSRFIKKEYDLTTQITPMNRMWGWINHYLVRNVNFMELKILNISDYLGKKLKKIVNESLELRYQLNKKREYSRILGVIPLTAFELAVSLILIFWVIVQRITVGSFQLYLRSLRNAEQNLSGLVNSFLEIYENYMYVADLIWFLNLESTLEKGNLSAKKMKGDAVDIEFRDVWFRYTKDKPWVLKNVNFKINSKENIALVGVNGAGKSTLIKLIARFYDPQKGQVFVNGEDIKNFDVNDWRESIAVLFQQFEGYIFSARDSIGYGDVARIGKLDEIKLAAKETGIDKFVEGLPLKYKNPLIPRFEKGVKPSAGQRQKFALSRTLFRKDAKLLILDEPTSNVDPEAEEDIFNKLVKGYKNRILIFVTQRFSTVRVADRIFVMDDGELIEQGTHRELMKLKGKYEKLFTLQAQAYLQEKWEK